MATRRLNLPNIITIARILACPVLFFIALAPGFGMGISAFVVFVLAALSDLWDGYLARKHGLITDMGKLLDPLADKLLLLATFIPIFIVSHRVGPEWPLPYWGPLPAWVLVVILGRELVITVFRQWAARREVVIAAGQSGKYKAFLQNLFIGGALLWFPLQSRATRGGWDHPAWNAFEWIHEIWIGIMLAAAVVLTVYSMFDYFWSYRALIRRRE